MHKYLHSDGGSSSDSGGGSAMIGQVLSAVISSVIMGMYQKGDAKKARQLQDRLAGLSLAQQKELEIRLQDVQSELVKLDIIYTYLAVQNNNEMVNTLQSKRYTAYMVLGGSITVFSLLLFILAQKNKKK